MPRYALDQGDLLRLVALASGVAVAEPDEPMAILRRSEFLAEEAADEPQAATDVAPAPLPDTLNRTSGAWAKPQPSPVTETGQGEAPAKPE